MERKEFQVNEVIFKDGIFQDWMYSICEGTVDIYSEYGTSKEKKLVTLTAGQFFGEIGMIGLMPRTATAVAADEYVVLEQINRSDLEEYLKKCPENLQPIMSSVSRRIRELTADLSMVAKMTSDALHERENGNATAGMLEEMIGKLLGKLKTKKASHNDFAIMQKRQQALSGEGNSVIRFSAGDVIFRAGEQADCMYEIYNGSVGIYSDYQTPHEKLLANLHTDDVFGEMGILDDMPRSATAVCLTPCSVLVVKPENFMQFFRDKPSKMLQILQQMCIQMRDLTQTYLQVCKTLEELPPVKESDIWEEEFIAKLEHFRESQLYSSVYDISCTANWLYDRL